MSRKAAAPFWFVGWIAVGAGFALAMLTILSIGILVLPVTMAVALVFATRRRSADGLPGLISGVALPLFFVAYLNRQGPGDICTYGDGSGSCGEQWNPWPFAIAGLAFLVGGVLVFLAIEHSRRRADS